MKVFDQTLKDTRRRKSIYVTSDQFSMKKIAIETFPLGNSQLELEATFYTRYQLLVLFLPQILFDWSVSQNIHEHIDVKNYVWLHYFLITRKILFLIWKWFLRLFYFSNRVIRVNYTLGNCNFFVDFLSWK